MEKGIVYKFEFYLIVLAGFLFTLSAGLLASWVDRKVTARLQWRQGPPWYQPFMDVAKLFCKEIIIPAKANRFSFLLSPLLGFAAVLVCSLLIGSANIFPMRSFLGDIIVTVYLLMIPAISLIIGAAASRNPLASLGASREMKLILAYELPFILALFVPIIKTHWSLSLGNIVLYQVHHGNVLASWSGFFALIVAILCVQAKMGLTPFDMSEAETEIMGGVLVEYSGAPLAVFKLTKAVLLFVLPMFLLTIFWSGVIINGWQTLFGLLKYVALLVVIIIIKNTNPRVRIDQAIRFFWGPVTLIAVLAVVMALLGA